MTPIISRKDKRITQAAEQREQLLSALTHGGKREGAGRKHADTRARQFKLRNSTLDALDACVPSGQKSAFVSDAIDEKLRREYGR